MGPGLLQAQDTMASPKRLDAAVRVNNDNLRCRKPWSQGYKQQREGGSSLLPQPWPAPCSWAWTGGNTWHVSDLGAKRWPCPPTGGEYGQCPVPVVRLLGSQTSRWRWDLLRKAQDGDVGPYGSSPPRALNRLLHESHALNTITEAFLGQSLCRGHSFMGRTDPHDCTMQTAKAVS